MVRICDLCGDPLYDSEHVTKLQFVYKVHGWYNFDEICLSCGMWLYTFLNGEKRIRLRRKKEELIEKLQKELDDSSAPLPVS